jgi:6-pyruvoyltetrahydropterin/6-carboxytetrahydropterin synthase
MFQIEIRHNFETAHRLSTPGSPLKCMSIHGHSWWVTVTLEGPRLDEADLLVEFGAFKSAWRKWVDEHIDHHLVLRRGDPMVAAVRGVFPESRLLELDHNPTTEYLAEFLFQQAEKTLATMTESVHVPARVTRVHIQETSVNAASYSAPRPAGAGD